MKTTGHLKSVSRDYITQKINLTVEIDTEEEIEFTSDILLDVAITKHKKKRSLDANAYCWVLLSKLADQLETSKDELYEEYIQMYAPPEEDDRGHIAITVLSTVPIDKIPGHWKKVRENGTYTAYIMLKGSSEFDTAEMSRFINHIVDDCKAQGIETMTPEQLERMVSAWKA